MARDYQRTSYSDLRVEQKHRAWVQAALASACTLAAVASPLFASLNPALMFILGLLPAVALGKAARVIAADYTLERERARESARRGGKRVLGAPPQRAALHEMVADARARGKTMIDRYLVGFELDSGRPLWIEDEEICRHACVFAKTGVGKTLWLESIMFQQMLRGRASGCTFIDAKRDTGTLAQIIMMATVAGRLEDLIVIDPFDTLHCYNFVLTNQRADVKARKVLRAGLPPTSDQSTTKHYDRLAADSIYRMVRAMESFGLAWSIRDIAVALSAFNLAYPQLRSLLHKVGERQALVELGHLASSYRGQKGQLDVARITDNLRGISSELHAIAGSEMGNVFCTHYTDLVLTDAILRGKIIYFMLPRLEEAESAARMVKVFREDLEVSIGEITSSRNHKLEDPHLVIVDEGSSTFGPTWANLFELARKGRFGLLFGAQSIGGLTDASMGLSEAFMERVMANVNLKVMMAIGDSRTATDMTEWIGKVSTLRKSVGAGVMSASTASFMRESQSVNLSEDEEDLVSAEELKHEMASEKGLAWFDMGDGRVIKGRSFWFSAELPERWEGREFVMRMEKFENDEVGLADWVDEQILSQEQRETEYQLVKPSPVPRAAPGPESKAEQPRGTAPQLQPASSKETPREQAPAPAGPFRLNLAQRGKVRGAVSAFKAPSEQPKEPPAPKTPAPPPVKEPKSKGMRGFPGNKSKR